MEIAPPHAAPALTEAPDGDCPRPRAAPAQLSLRTRFINPFMEYLPASLSEAEGRSIRDMLALYFPNGPVGKTVACYGGAGVSQILSVNSGFYQLNHVIKQMLGMPSLDTSLDTSMVAGGKGHRISNAFLGALGEAMERFAGVLKAFREDTEVVYGSYASLQRQGYPCLHPRELHLFAKEQYRAPGFLFEPFTEDVTLGWIEGRRLRSGEAVWVPAQLALFFYFNKAQEASIAYAASCGLAAHVDEAAAVYNGITELIERDGMMVSWYCRVPPARLILDRPLQDRDFNRAKLALDELPGHYTCYLHRLDMPDLYVVSAIEIAEHMGRYGYYAGGASAVDPDEAVVKALVEYGQSEAQIKLSTLAPRRGWAQGAQFYFGAEADKPLEEMSTFLEHLGYYGHPVNWERLKWFHAEGQDLPLTALPAPRAYRDTQHKLDALLDVLGTYGIDPIVIDQTLPQMEQLRVVKVLIPELVHPHVSSRPYLGHPRLYEVPMRMGLRDRPLTYDELQPGPVPFP